MAMASTYIAERAIISCMARELRDLRSLDKPGLELVVLVISGFSKQDAMRYLDRAIESERARRLAMYGVVEAPERRVG
jgi:hypothetical protein